MLFRSKSVLRDLISSYFDDVFSILKQNRAILSEKFLMFFFSLLSSIPLSQQKSIKTHQWICNNLEQVPHTLNKSFVILYSHLFKHIKQHTSNALEQSNLHVSFIQNLYTVHINQLSNMSLDEQIFLLKKIRYQQPHLSIDFLIAVSNLTPCPPQGYLKPLLDWYASENNTQICAKLKMQIGRAHV